MSSSRCTSSSSLAPGHLLPIADMAALFAGRGVKCTILATPVNAQAIRSTVDHANDASRGTEGALAIDIAVVPFPDVVLPPVLECGWNSTDDRENFFQFQGLQFPREPFGRFLAEDRPDAVVADSFLDWLVDELMAHRSSDNV